MDLADLAQLQEPPLNLPFNDFTKPSLAFCKRCDDDIPLERQALGNVKYCILCQTLAEKNI